VSEGDLWARKEFYATLLSPEFRPKNGGDEQEELALRAAVKRSTGLDLGDLDVGFWLWSRQHLDVMAQIKLDQLPAAFLQALKASNPALNEDWVQSFVHMQSLPLHSQSYGWLPMWYLKIPESVRGPWKQNLLGQSRTKAKLPLAWSVIANFLLTRRYHFPESECPFHVQLTVQFTCRPKPTSCNIS
jgi:hypothetical protein